MNVRRRLALLILPFVIPLLPAVASAQTPDADRATARTLALEGKAALDKKDYALAADRFSRADALIHAPTLLLGLARAEVGLGKLVAAQEAYNRILREGVPPSSPPAFARAVEDAKIELQALASKIPHLILQVTGPAAALVTVDGASVPSAALGVKRPVDPGRHAIRATAAGFEASEATVDLPSGKVETVTLELKPLQTAPAPEAAPAPVEAPPQATRPSPSPESERQPSDDLGLSSPPPDTPPPSGSLQKTLGFVALGLGGAGAIVGIVTGLVAVSKHGSLIERCGGPGCPPNVRADVDSYYTVGAVSTGSFIAGGALGTLGAVLLVTAPRAQKTMNAPMTLLLGAGFIGAKGRF